MFRGFRSQLMFRLALIFFSIGLYTSLYADNLGYELFLEETQSELIVTVRGPENGSPFMTGLYYVAVNTSFPGEEGLSQEGEHNRQEFVVRIERSNVTALFEVVALVYDTGTNRWAILGPEQYAQLGSNGNPEGGSSGGLPVTLEGRRLAWHPLTFKVELPFALDESPNTFLNYQFWMHIGSGTGWEFHVPGYFAADGDAANSGASSGSIVEFKWMAPASDIYVADFDIRFGSNIGISTDQNAGSSILTGQKTFYIGATQALSGFEHQGRVVYDGTRYLKHAATGELYLKNGADSPESFFADSRVISQALVAELDGLSPAGSNKVPNFLSHENDWQRDDPSWRGGKGKGLIGAVNYLAQHGANAFYSVNNGVNGGDSATMHPWVSPGNKEVFDVSRLAQMNMVFEHAARKGVATHYVIQERENDWSTLMNGTSVPAQVDKENKLLLKELIARFSYLPAFFINMGEEFGSHDLWPNNTRTQAQVNARIAYLEDQLSFIHTLYPYGRPLVGIHNFVSSNTISDEVFFGAQGFTYLSYQINDGSLAPAKMLALRQQYPDLPMAFDELGPYHTGVKPDASRNDRVYRRTVLLAALMRGFFGVESYFGYQRSNPIYCSDLECYGYQHDRELFEENRSIIEFVAENIPLTELTPDDSYIVSRRTYEYSMVSASGDMLVFFTDGFGADEIKLPSAGTFHVLYYDLSNSQSFSGQPISGANLAMRALNPPPGAADYLAVLVKR